MSRYLIHDLKSSITLSLLMRVFACFFVFLKLKKGWNYTSLCSLVLLFTHSTMDEKSLTGTANSCCDTIFWCRNSKSWNSCALLSHHLVNSCRLAHNFSAAWSMGSKESGLIPVLLYHVPGYMQDFFFFFSLCSLIDVTHEMSCIKDLVLYCLFW